MLNALSHGMLRILSAALNTLVNGGTYHPVIAARLIRDLERFRGSVHVQEMVRFILTEHGPGGLSRPEVRQKAIQMWAECLDTPFMPGIERAVDAIIAELREAD